MALPCAGVGRCASTGCARVAIITIEIARAQIRMRWIAIPGLTSRLRLDRSPYSSVFLRPTLVRQQRIGNVRQVLAERLHLVRGVRISADPGDGHDRRILDDRRPLRENL